MSLINSISINFRFPAQNIQIWHIDKWMFFQHFLCDYGFSKKTKEVVFLCFFFTWPMENIGWDFFSKPALRKQLNFYIKSNTFTSFSKAFLRWCFTKVKEGFHFGLCFCSTKNFVFVGRNLVFVPTVLKMKKTEKTSAHKWEILFP